MSEEAASAAPAAATPATAPSVAPTAAPAAVAETSAVSAAVPAAEPVIANDPIQPEPAPEPVVEAAPVLLGADDFGWDDWNGEGTGLPEHVGPWYDKFQTRFNDDHRAELESAETRYKQLDEAFTAALSNTEDPRYTELEGKHTALQAQYDQMRQWRAQREALDEQDAQEWSKWFIEQNREVLTKEGNRDKYISYLQADIDPGDAITLLDLPDDAVAVALKARQEGAPSAWAAKVASLQAAQRTLPPPRATAEVVSGASGGTGRTANAASRSINDTKDFGARRMAAVQGALRKHRR